VLTDEQFAQLEQYEADWTRREYLREPDPNLWRWAPTPLPKVREMFATVDMSHALAGLDHVKFFDAGCGIGTKLYMAEGDFGWDAIGWELYPEYVAFARNTLGQNASTHDLRVEEPIWHAYDVVMISRPFKDEEQETAWERKVQTQMRPGAVLIASFAAVKPYSWRWLYRAPWRLAAVKPLPGEQDHTQANVPNAIPVA
jgi:SAM-dependent methyltransferase